MCLKYCACAQKLKSKAKLSEPMCLKYCACAQKLKSKASFSEPMCLKYCACAFLWPRGTLRTHASHASHASNPRKWHMARGSQPPFLAPGARMT